MGVFERCFRTPWRPEVVHRLVGVVLPATAMPKLSPAGVKPVASVALRDKNFVNHVGEPRVRVSVSGQAHDLALVP